MVRQNRTLKKVNKVLARVEKHIEETRDALEDLEIEFEVLKATVKRLKDAPVEAVEAPEEVDEEIDIENSTNITIDPKVLIQIFSTVSRLAHMSSQCSMLASKPGG